MKLIRILSVVRDRRPRDLTQRVPGLSRRGDRARDAARPACRERGAESRRDRARLGRRCGDRPGPGIAPEYQGQIFEKFGRAAGSAKPGTGLGLFLARSFAEAHGGSLAVESQPGEGATFTLRLPTS